MDLLGGLATFFAGLGGTVLLLMPGYIIGAVFSRGTHGPALPERSFLALSALGGLVVHLIAFNWTVSLARRIVRDGWDAHAFEGARWVGVVLIVIPTILGLILGAASERTTPGWLYALMSALGLSSSVRTREAWNWVFRRLRKGVYVRIQLLGGEAVLGKFSTSSFASSDARLRDLYLEELWVADSDGWFQEPYPATRGLWISGNQIESVSFFEGADSPTAL